MAVRPLKVKELAEILAIDFDAPGGVPKLNKNFRWADQEQAILSACSSLVVIVNDSDLESDLESDPNSDSEIQNPDMDSDSGSDSDSDPRRVQFSHYSVKEFLTSDRLANATLKVLGDHYIRLESAHTIMAQACLGVLLRLDDHMDKKTIKSFPLAKYAGRHLVDHAEFEDVLSHIHDGLDNLLDPDKPHIYIWLWLQVGDYSHRDWMDGNLDSYSDLGESLSNHSEHHLFPDYPPRAPPLHYTLFLGHLCLSQYLILKRPGDLYVTNNTGRTVLHLVVHKPGCKVTQMLIERTAAIDPRDSKGRTPLYHAMHDNQHEARDEFLQVVQILLDHGANVEAQNNHGSTPLHVAASRMGQETVQLLVKKSTNTNLRNNYGETALHKASQRGHLGIVRLFLDHGADLDVQDNRGSTSLHLATHYEGQKDVRQFLKHVDQRNYQVRNDIEKALQDDHLDIIRLLLDHRANVDLQDDRGSTPLHLATHRMRQEAVQLLLEHGANIALRDDKGQTPLHEAAQRSHLGILQLILDHDADVNALDNDGLTPLHLAISEASLEAVQLLLKHGASVHSRNNLGETPFQAASTRGLQEITELLSMHNQSEKMS